jgi:hypothetical protein
MSTKDGMMKRVHLETGDGQLVCVGRMLPFRVQPEVVLWGSRCFALHLAGGEGRRTVYREVFACALVEWDVPIREEAVPSKMRPGS